MGKKKGFKIKTVKVPEEKFLVVTNAWGLNTAADIQPQHLNNVSAWFEIMLSERHPGVTLRSLYYQGTHKNLIVELPREVTDISPYLGRHNYNQFTTNSPHSERYAEVFEYKYSRHGDPAEKAWTVGYPTYAKIPPNIPIRRPYPVPTMASPPPIDVADYASPVPPEVYTQRTALLAQLNRDAELATIKDADLIKYSPPLDEPSKTDSNNHPASASQQSLPVEIEAAEDFLATLSFQQPVVKEEPATDDAHAILQSVQEEGEGDDYVPSNELLSMLADLPPDLDLLGAATEEVEEPTIRIKPEPVDDELPDYEPSQELFDAIASLEEPDEELQAGAISGIKQEQSESAVEAFEFRVKPEPVDDYIIPDSYDSSYLNLSVKEEDVKRSIKNEDSKAGIRIKYEDTKTGVRIKPEPIETTLPTNWSSREDDNYVKRERDSDTSNSKYERTAVSQLSTSSNHHSNQHDAYTKSIKRERSLSHGTNSNSRSIKSVKREDE